MGEPAWRQRHGVGDSLRGRCQGRLAPAEHEALGALRGTTVGEVPLGCILAPLMGSNNVGPLLEPVVRSGSPEERGHLPLGTSGTPSMEPPPLPHRPPGSISAWECASGGRDVAGRPFSNGQLMVTWHVGQDCPVSRKGTEAWGDSLSQCHTAG